MSLLASSLDRLAGVLPATAQVNQQGHLILGGCDLVELAERFGTPLYVYDQEQILRTARAYRDTLHAALGPDALVCYASKAYSAPWLLKLLAIEGLGLDVVSGGELAVAQAAGFPMDRVYFHGNNKSLEEIEQALDAGVARFVVDNLDEIERLAGAAERRGVRQKILLRVTPGIDAHTHEHIKTGVLDTKFGLSIGTGAAAEGVKAALARPALDLVGLHVHIGSQIFDLEPYTEAVARVFRFAAQMRDQHGLDLREMSPGGGFGMRYLPEHDPPTTAEATAALARAVKLAAAASGFERTPAVTIEPGRSIVGPAAVALYRVGSVKSIPGVRTYVAVDGGMADNIRPTAYGAEYSAVLANRAADARDSTVAVAGKYCESGDVLIRATQLPRPRVGDLVAVPGSGAYHLAMASNYNMALRPAVVVVADGQARLVRRRETPDDLLRAEIF